ncbi:MAG: hypothetical protein WBZ36_23770, partial [Candidatus Nitrosopolaris sp.]
LGWIDTDTDRQDSSDSYTPTQKTPQDEHQAAEESECEAPVYERKVETSADENAKSETGAIKRDEEISACFDRAKENLNGLLKSKRRVIRDLAEELERLGRPVDHIAAEIVHELRNCEELSRSQIYSYLDDKYKNQTQAQRRKGKKESNPDPKTGTESSLKQTITVGNNGRQTISNEHDTQELKESAETPAEYVTSNQQSNLANLQKSDWNPDPKTGTESLSQEQRKTEQSTNTNTSASEPLQTVSEFEFIIPKEKYEMVMDAMDKSKSVIFVKCDGKKKFLRALADVDN